MPSGGEEGEYKMPMVNLACPNGHASERYVHTWERLYNEPSRICGCCGLPFIPAASFGTPLLYFSESTPRHIANLGATIRSHGEHVRVMKDCGVEPSTDWHASRKQSDGLQTKARPPHPRATITGDTAR